MVEISATRRFNSVEGFIVPLTIEDIKGAGAKAIEGIPEHYNRKIRDARIEGEVRAIVEARVQEDRTYQVGDRILYRRTYNMGTSKWPDIYYPVVCSTIVKVSPKTVETEGCVRIEKRFILGRIEGVE